MKKQIIAILMALAMIAGGCAPQPEAAAPVEIQPAEIAVESDADGAPKAPKESDIAAEMTAEAEAEQKLRMTAYREALENLLSASIFPNGESADMMEGFGSMEENRFAVADIDNDWEEELIIIFSTAPMAGISEMVYRFDPETDALKEVISEFPDIAFYENGYATAIWSHNQGMAGDLEDFWPYSVYKFNEQSKVFDPVASVDAWSKSMAPTSFYDDSIPFPDDIDTDGVGVVYLITENGEERTVSESDYQAWRDNMLSGPMYDIEYKNITKENISAIQ